MATWREDIITALENLGGISNLADIYKEVKKIRPLPHPPSIDSIVRGEIEKSSSDSEAFMGNDVFFSVDGLGKGIWGLRSKTIHTPKALDIELPNGDESPSSVKQEVYRKLRDTKLAREIKLLHKNKCQICSIIIKIDPTTNYSEAHHIKPLGKPHNGPDIPGNIIVLCPNCHSKLDYGAIELEINDINIIKGHNISTEYIEYHNHNIVKDANKTE